MNDVYGPITNLHNNDPLVNTDVHNDIQSNEEIKDEDLMKFVESLSGRILELGDVLDRMRNEPVCTPDIVKGVIMRAARVWSETEPIRLRMVKFMLEYLLRDEERQGLGLDMMI